MRSVGLWVHVTLWVLPSVVSWVLCNLVLHWRYHLHYMDFRVRGFESNYRSYKNRLQEECLINESFEEIRKKSENERRRILATA